MNRTPLIGLLLSMTAIAACKTAVDPLDEYRATCRTLQAQGQLRAGLAIDDCAKQLKTAADESDPAKRADELAGRIQALVQEQKGKEGPPRDELRQAIAAVQALGKPAAPALQTRFEASHDPDLRIALAKALVGICYEDCAKQKFDCIVPALLEGATSDKPAEIRQASLKSLASCTGKEFGDDAAAWTSWWASVKPHP